MARHLEIIAKPSLWVTTASLIIDAARGRQRRLMAEREAEIDAGLVHHTPAMVDALAKLELVRDGEMENETRSV
jgi:hypothetical protein